MRNRAKFRVSRSEAGSPHPRLPEITKVASRKLLDEEASARQIRLGMVLEAAGMVTWEWDIATRSICYSNNISAIVRGEEVEPYCTLDTLLETVHPEDREQLARTLDQTSRTGDPWECEYRVRMVDGTYRWILGEGKIVVKERGKAVRVLGLSLDINQRKEAEEKLRRSEGRFRLLADIAERLLATQDPQEAVNQLCREVMAQLDCQLFFNYLAEDPPGPACGDRPDANSARRLHLHAWAGISDQNARRIEWLDYGEAVCGSVARDGCRIVAENVQCSEDPRTRLVKSYGVKAYCCHPLLSAGGRVVGTLSFGTTTRPGFTAEEVELMRAITNQVAVAMRRLRAMEELEAARAEAVKEQNRLAAVMETLPVGVCILDAQGGVVRTNAAYRELWGGPLPPVRGVSDYAAYEACWAATGKPVQPEEWASARAVLHNETVVNQELRIRSFDGRTANVLNSAAPIHDVGGRVIGCAVAIRDITEFKRAEDLNRRLAAQVQEAQKQESLGVLAGGIAHDFNNLLTVIIGNLGLAGQELPAEAPARRLLGRAEEASKHAADLCQQMLAYVGKTVLSFCPTQVNQVLQDTARLFAASLPKSVRLRWDLAEQLPLVHADPGQLRQIVMNLLINASEAIGNQPGQVTLTTGLAPRTAQELESPWAQDPLPGGEYVFVEVTDTGCGIESSVLSRVFDPFFSTKFTGRGLGLAAVLGIVRSHRGTIQVQSAPGRGSAFRVWLPALDGPARVPAASGRPARDWHGSGTILVVDDEEALRFTAQGLLEVLGFESVGAADGQEAIEIYRANPDRFRCVLLDATMPKLDGEATYRELARIRPGVQVVLSSGYAKNNILSRFPPRALSGFLQKPYTLKDLSAVLEHLNTSPERVAQS